MLDMKTQSRTTQTCLFSSVRNINVLKMLRSETTKILAQEGREFSKCFLECQGEKPSRFIPGNARSRHDCLEFQQS